MKKMKFGMLVMVAVLVLVSAVSALPATATMVGHIPGNVGRDVYWTIDISNSMDPVSLPNANGYDGWCVDSGHYMTAQVSYPVTAYSTVQSDPLPAGLPYSYANWYKINYMLNNPYTADWRIMQAAMWHYDGLSAELYPGIVGDPVRPDTQVSGGYDHVKYAKYIADVDAAVAAMPNGKFIPKCGQLYAIILYNPNNVQSVIVEGKTDRCNNSPEFPTLALPVAMLVGVVGAVQYVRSKNE
jgi:hypothetical protein